MSETKERLCKFCVMDHYAWDQPHDLLDYAEYLRKEVVRVLDDVKALQPEVDELKTAARVFLEFGFSIASELLLEDDTIQKRADERSDTLYNHELEMERRLKSILTWIREENLNST